MFSFTVVSKLSTPPQCLDYIPNAEMTLTITQTTMTTAIPTTTDIFDLQ